MHAAQFRLPPIAVPQPSCSISPWLHCLHAYLVQQAEDVVIVHYVLDLLHSGPGRGLVVALAQLEERHLVHGLDLRHIAFPVAYSARVADSL